MSDFDLNIDNYSLDDLLNLFHLKYNFTTEELKKAKRIVLKTHPDKSKLPKEYFLFFSKAYKVLVNVNEFRNKSSKKLSNDEYSEIIDEDENDKKEIVTKLKDKKNFSKFFNKMFEQMKNASDEETKGYSDWLKESNDNNLQSNNIQTLHSNFEKLKTEKRELIVHKGIEDVVDNLSTGSQNLSGIIPSSYSNNELFTKNSYIDVKEAYDNAVIPVTQRDFENKKKYNSIQEIQIDRKNTASFSKSVLDEQAKLYFQNKKKVDDDEGAKTAFHLIQQEEVSRKNNDLFWGHLKLLSNNNK
tara:strand:+ start:6272 stop:7171 length:900 start_codon:yes stop_codon:yes gene_type:complete